MRPIKDTMTKLLFFIGLSLSLILMGCGEENSDPAETTTSLSSLLAATGAVSASGASSLSVGALATTGITLGSADGLSWTSSHSRPFCESLSISKQLYREASQPDLIQCYVGAMVDSGLFDANIYNGDYWLYTLAGDEEMDGGNQIKFKATKAADGSIASFEMFMCMGGTAESPTQDGYLSQTLTGTSATITSVNIGSYGSDTFSSRLSVTGGVSGGAWTSKEITASRASTYGSAGWSGTFGETVTLTQGAGSLTIDGYRSGTWLQSGSFGSTFSDSYYAVTQLLGATNMSTFALGDGSAKYNINWSGDTDGDGTDDSTYAPGAQTESWNGDDRTTLGTASDGTYYSSVSGATLPTVGSAPTVSFSAGETWDCSGTSNSVDFQTGGASLQAAMAACDTKFGGHDHGWVDCHNAQ